MCGERGAVRKGREGAATIFLGRFRLKSPLNVACGGTVVGLQAYRAAYEGYFWECVRLVLHSGAQNSLRTYVHTFHTPGSPPHQGGRTVTAVTEMQEARRASLPARAALVYPHARCALRRKWGDAGRTVRPASGCSPELCLRRTPAQPTSSPIAGGRAGSVSRSPPSSRPRGLSAWRARQVLSLEC